MFAAMASVSITASARIAAVLIQAGAPDGPPPCPVVADRVLSDALPSRSVASRWEPLEALGDAGCAVTGSDRDHAGSAADLAIAAGVLTPRWKHVPARNSGSPGHRPGK